jgi:hypothetical protein
MIRIVILDTGLALVLAATTSGPCGATDGSRIQKPTRGANEKGETNMRIRVTIEGKAVAATLADNETAREFAALLPVTLTLKDYADNEKISDLPKKLSTKGAPATYDPSAGDITYYAPWGNLALFHKDGHDSPGLIKLGKFDSGAELLRRPGALKATFERMKD